MGRGDVPAHPCDAGDDVGRRARGVTAVARRAATAGGLALVLSVASAGAPPPAGADAVGSAATVGATDDADAAGTPDGASTGRDASGSGGPGATAVPVSAGAPAPSGDGGALAVWVAGEAALLAGASASVLAWRRRRRHPPADGTDGADATVRPMRYRL